MKRDFIDKPLVQRAHEWVEGVLRPGDSAVDATLGNGHDTLFLAARVGDEGHVFGFDVQTEALDKTRHRLREAGMAERVTLLRRGHQYLADHLTRPVQAVMFNLGYLPGGDKRRITLPHTTLTALAAAAKALAEGGIITVIAYRGHAGGEEEAGVIQGWMEELPKERFTVRIEAPASAGKRDDTPLLFVVRRVVPNQS